MTLKLALIPATAAVTIVPNMLLHMSVIIPAGHLLKVVEAAAVDRNIASN